MNITRLTQVRRAFDRPDVPHHIKRHNMRTWVRCIRILGDKWLIAKPYPVAARGDRC